MDVLEWLDERPRKYHIIIGILFTLAIASLDYLTGFENRMKIIYLVPISYATWYVKGKTGIGASALIVLTILYPGMVTGRSHDNYRTEIWDKAIYTVFFAVVILLLSKLRTVMQQRAGLTTKLQNAVNAVKELSGILPICANCKKIRDEEGYWHDVDVYISRHTKAEFTHGICAECANKLYPSLFDKIGK